MACNITLSSLFTGYTTGTITYLGYNASAGNTTYPATGWGANPATPPNAPNSAGSPIAISTAYTTVDPTNATPGYYGFLNTSGASGCQDFEVSYFQVVARPNSGTTVAATTYCNNAAVSITLNTLIAGEATGGTFTWSGGISGTLPTVSSVPLVTTANNYAYNTVVDVPVGAAVGTYTFTYTVASPAGTNSANCPNCAAATTTGSFVIVSTPSAGTAAPGVVCN